MGRFETAPTAFKLPQMRILNVQEHPHHKDLLNLTLSNQTSLTISREIYFKERLSEGKEFSGEDLSALVKEESYHRCHQASLNFLKYRPRSELELKQRLLRKGFLPDAIEKTLKNLKDVSLVDDKAFASLWTDSRKSNRSRRLIKLELQRKGISKDIAQQVTSNIDEDSTALAIARKKARSLHGKAPREFQGKILTYLVQKGFNYDVSKRAARTVMSEVADFSPVSIDDENKK